MQYEPELFPGLIYRMMEPKIVLLIFVSGKVVLTGAKVRAVHGGIIYRKKAVDFCRVWLADGVT